MNLSVLPKSWSLVPESNWAFVLTKDAGFHYTNKALAEEVGFEPTSPKGAPAFQAGAFDHSATPPWCTLEGSNLLLSAYEADALADMLSVRGLCPTC